MAKISYPRKFRDEGDVKRAVKYLLAKYKIQEAPDTLGTKRNGEPWMTTNTWYFMPSMTGFGRGGIPDFVCCILGRFVSIETKYGKNTPTERQIDEAEDIVAAGGTHLVINESDLAALDMFLNRMINGE